MQRNPDTVDISSERDSPLRPIAIEEEVTSMQDATPTKKEGAESYLSSIT